MNAEAAPGHATSPRVWLFVVVGVLALVLLAVAYVNWRQFKLLDAASHYQNDALGWSFSQLETEQLRLRNALKDYVGDPLPPLAERVQLRYDIFVSRLGLVDHERAAVIMSAETAYRPAIDHVRAFVLAADRHLGTTPAQPLDAVSGAALIEQLDELNPLLQNLSLGASHLLYQRATDRNTEVRQQTQMTIALTAVQCLLLLALAVIVLRQVRALTERRRNLEALAENLGIARHDAEAANRAKSVFLANMSHEIRTPFHGMLGMMSLLQEGGLSPQQAVYLDTARESAQHLLTILNDILDISRLESGRLQVAPQTVDLPQLIGQVDSLMRVQAHAKGLAMDIDVAPDVPRWVHADPTRVKQILFNLLNNALKFTSAGGVTLAVRTASTVEGGLEFSVTDTGIGMDDATRSRLFQRFMQGDESPSRRNTGTGLGLEISRDLARLMGGDITVSSRPGVGSVFTATLPLPSVGAPAPTPDVDAGAPVPRLARPLRVLVAEDHPVNRAYLAAVLDKLGHHAVFAANGHGVMQAIADAPEDAGFDVVLMDLHMPGMDGFSAARSIRALPVPRCRLPIVALTADAFQTSRQLALEAGMDGFLTKPAHLPQLREALNRFGGAAAAPPGAVTTTTTTTTTAPAPAPQDSDALLDLATLDDVRKTLAPMKYGELLGALLGGRGPAVAELRQALLNMSHGALQSLSRQALGERAHALKGAALSLGLHGVGMAAGQLQAASASGAPEQLGPLIDQLERRFEASVAECVRRGLLPGAAGGVTPPAAPARA